ncbi:MAG: type II toxin-antitoxin system RelB/DinJ family antitoxin [Ezakiella sp.]|uniref:type II toxin-antitoxin system RelB/DinJ family antitoxin n=1 Tax=Ezakiella sp. TaxID=1935205 RepID=UPI002971F035|nr:type II toxin-antitoxin system RelB/DinJ family antitoxin [Ezakiella sp.]MDD7730990.1 type II toxin-antitoxin system RelB/DinJ family antitoxin [Eubacteriales bacterium]MDY6079756.1 type II toxin-antitoxin system RelB/DinJ family antitoxin [Ezakiella sp.]
MEKTNLTISLDKKDKEMFQDLLNKLGLNISVAFNMFVKQSIRNNSLPLDLTLNELDSVSDRIMDKYDMAFEELSK